MGNSFTLADVAAIPYINRADMVGLAGLWEDRRARVADWYARMRQRPTFDSAITAYWDDDARLRFDVPRDEISAEVAAHALLTEDCRVWSIRISSALLVGERRTSSANGAFGRHERHDNDGIRLVTAASR